MLISGRQSQLLGQANGKQSLFKGSDILYTHERMWQGSVTDLQCLLALSL